MHNSDFLKIDPQNTSTTEIYKQLISAITPRPIALVSTISINGQGNLAPFSFYNGVCSNPPCVSISIARNADGSKKDTLRNIEACGEFVVNSANRWLIEKLVTCGAAYEYGINEMEKSGLSPLPSEIVKPVRVKESAVHMECKLYKAVEIGDGSPGSCTLIIGQILLFHISREIQSSGRIDVEKYQPMSRLGGADYAAVGERLTLPIPKV